ncbi:MAG TPA: hypothetical protein VGI39_13400 [Polyangiaceae bacterium]
MRRPVFGATATGFGAALAAVTVTCIPELARDDSLVNGPRVLAVRADPAEAKPGAAVTFTAFAVGADGGMPNAALAWDFCTAPKPLTEDNVVSNACLDSSSWIGVGSGTTTQTSMPSKACALFGPDPPPGGFRPRDPDVTGGYYQPLRAALAGAPVTFDLVRVRCNLANAGAAGAAAFAAAYVPNQNPQLLPLTLPDGTPLTASPTVSASTRLTLTASWGAADAETYADFDVASQSVTPLREAMRVSWYATSGAFDTEATAPTASDPATRTANNWTAPSAPGLAHLYVVLRDSRGGVDFSAYDVTITASH